VLGGTLGLRAAGAFAAILRTPAELTATYGLLLLAVAMVVAIFEEERRSIEDNLLGVSSLNLATSGFQAAQSLQDNLEMVLERLLKVYGLSKGILSLSRTERQEGLFLSRGFAAELGAEWQRLDLNRVAADVVNRMGGLVNLRDLERPKTAGRLDADASFLELRRTLEGAGAEALLAMTLRTKAGVYGTLLLAHRPDRELSAPELRLLSVLGGQIAMAVENFLLARDSHRRAEELHLVNETGQAMSSTLNPDALLRLIHREIEKLMDAQNFYIALWVEAHDEIRFELEVENGAYLPKRTRRARQAITEYVLRSGQALLLKTDPAQFRASHGIEPATR
ncbi:MAG: GAF domain-containing protein, partial [Burkholderiales bacterium]